MKVVGNCPQCGNPIWADGPEITKRTCFCVVPIRTQPLTITPQPYHPPYVSPLTVGDPPYTIQPPAISTTSNTLVTYVTPKPPDEDAGMVT